jgi:hypothetical protein
MSMPASKLIQFFVAAAVMAVSIGSAMANGHEAAPPAKPASPKQMIDELNGKCMKAAKQLRDEQICKAKRPAIENCINEGLKVKDAKATMTKCELMHLR